MLPKAHIPPDLKPVPIVPTEDRWRAMTPKAKEQFLIEMNEALKDEQLVMSEGRPHKKAKSRAIDMLGNHFRAMGRRIYLAEEMSVAYPGERGFTPDVLAVLDVEEPEDDQRMSWVVLDEGKGIDWVLEVLWAGDRQKDLVDNVERYARLGIPEYFVYDQKKQRLLGYRLPADSKRYAPIMPQGGLYRSEVLGVDLAIVENTLKFYQGTAELYDTTHVIRRLQGIVENLEARANDADTRIDKALAVTRKAIIRMLESRGITLSAAGLSKLEESTDADELDTWLTRTLSASSEDDFFGNSSR
jgi:Uma2 family endonuclease